MEKRQPLCTCSQDAREIVRRKTTDRQEEVWLVCKACGSSLRIVAAYHSVLLLSA